MERREKIIMNVNNIGIGAGNYVQPLKQPSYKDDQINGLKAQESSYEAQIAQLEAGDDEENAAVLQDMQGKLAEVESQLEDLRPVTAVKPRQNIAPPAERPLTDEEMNARFGAAYSVELSLTRQMDEQHG